MKGATYADIVDIHAAFDGEPTHWLMGHDVAAYVRSVTLWLDPDDELPRQLKPWPADKPLGTILGVTVVEVDDPGRIELVDLAPLGVMA